MRDGELLSGVNNGNQEWRRSEEKTSSSSEDHVEAICLKLCNRSRHFHFQTVRRSAAIAALTCLYKLVNSRQL